jgi:DNA-binding LacI/PurR family transcriptional regulator
MTMPSKPNPTIIDVARQAGLSKSTVSRVIRGEQGNVSDSARQKVLDAIRVLGYEQNAVASSMRTAQTFTIMLAIPDITNPFWPEVARGLQDVMDREGYAVVFANSDWDGQRELGFLRLARRSRFDGIVINPVGVSNADILAVQIPAVLIGLRSDFPDFDIVGSDSYGATLQALDYLYSRGHQRIGILLGIHNDRPSQARLDGYLAFLQKTGLPYEPGLLLNVPFEFDGGFQGMQQLLNQAAPPSAVLAGNDIIAIGAMHAASGAGLHIPEDISIMGIDDIYAAAASIPPLTTVAKQKYEIGCQAGNLLLERIRGGYTGPARRRVIPCQLIERSTTASARVLQP